MNICAPLTTFFKVEVDSRKAVINFSLFTHLGDIGHELTLVNLSSEFVIACANALRQADQILMTGKPGNTTGWPSPDTVMDIDLRRGGIVLAIHTPQNEHYFFLSGKSPTNKRADSMINKCADALLAAALDLRMPNQGTATRH